MRRNTRAVRYLLGHQSQQFLMIHPPEEVLQVRIHDPLAAAVDLLPDFAQGVLCRSPSPLSVVAFIEYRLEDRLQPIEQRLRAHPILDRRNAQPQKLSRLAHLWDLYLPHGLRLIDPFLQFAL
jgi:hypothetical protein